MMIELPKQFTFPAHTFGTKAGFLRNVWVSPRIQVHLAYFVRFVDGFDFALGGKLPGVKGGTNASGGKYIAGTGFSVRPVWQECGCLALYIYHMNNGKGRGRGRPDWHRREGYDAKRFGDEIVVPNFKFKMNHWHCIDLYVKTNTKGKQNGLVAVVLDGEKRFEVERLLFSTEKQLKTDAVSATSFFGGSLQCWAPERDSTIQFSDAVLRAVPPCGFEPR
jgi:hypothetical protein